MVDPVAVRLQKRRQSILDYVKPDFVEAEVQARRLRRRAARHAPGIDSRGGAKPDRRCTHDHRGRAFRPTSARRPTDKSQGNVAGPNADFMPIGYAQMDVLAAAIACDLTRVATLQWGGTGVYSPYLGSTFTKDHHTISHDDQSAPGSPIEVIQNWYAKHFAYLLGKLDSMAEGNGTVLDNTAVVWFSEIAQGSHEHYDMPFVIGGRRRRHTSRPAATSTSIRSRNTWSTTRATLASPRMAEHTTISTRPSWT